MNDLKRPGTYLDLPAHIDRLDTSYTYTSRLYPILVNEDEVTPSLRVRELKFPLVKVEDRLDINAPLVQIEKRPIRIDSFMPPDSLDIGASLVSIDLRTPLVESSMPPDGLDVGAGLETLELKKVLITNKMVPEGLDTGAELTSIALEPQP